jgi:hypothetical protein
VACIGATFEKIHSLTTVGRRMRVTTEAVKTIEALLQKERTTAWS